MKIIRWISFLPLGFLFISIAQGGTALLAVSIPWLAVLLVFLVGFLLTFATALPVTIAPKPAIGATILLTIFIPLEAITFVSLWPEIGGAERTVRFMADGYLILGAFIGATQHKLDA